MKRYVERYRRITKHIVIVTLVLFLLSVFFCILMLSYQASNQSRHYAQKIECFDDTEYTITGISYEDFVKKLIITIKADSNACYAERSELRNNKDSGCIVDTMSVENNSFTLDDGRTNNVSITFFVPYDNDQVKLSGNLFYKARLLEERYKEYNGKLKLRVRIIDTQPIRILLDRCWDYDEQRELEKGYMYFRENYLDSICQYEPQNNKNAFFFLLNWCFIHLYYVVPVIIIVFVWVFIWHIFNTDFQNGKRDSSF